MNTYKITYRRALDINTLLTTKDASMAYDDFTERTTTENGHNASGKCDTVKIKNDLVHTCYDKNMGRIRQQYELITLTK